MYLLILYDVDLESIHSVIHHDDPAFPGGGASVSACSSNSAVLVVPTPLLLWGVRMGVAMPIKSVVMPIGIILGLFFPGCLNGFVCVRLHCVVHGSIMTNLTIGVRDCVWGNLEFHKDGDVIRGCLDLSSIQSASVRSAVGGMPTADESRTMMYGDVTKWSTLIPCPFFVLLVSPPSQALWR